MCELGSCLDDHRLVTGQIMFTICVYPQRVAAIMRICGDCTIPHRNPNEGLPVPVTWPQYDDVTHTFLNVQAEPRAEEESDERLAEYG